MTNEHEYEPTREDVLIGRVVDHEATPADWAALDKLAEGDPSMWSRLGRAQRAHAGLRTAVEDAIAGAELVEVPGGRPCADDRAPAWRRVTAGAGWAVAAVLGLALLNPLLTARHNTGVSMTAGFPMLLSQASPEEAYTQYVASGLADGRVVTEMPALVLEQWPLPDGRGTEVMIVRRVVERLEVPRLANFAFRPDEHGIARLTPVDPTPAPPPASPPASEHGDGYVF